MIKEYAYVSVTLPIGEPIEFRLEDYLNDSNGTTLSQPLLQLTKTLNYGLWKEILHFIQNSLKDGLK